ncbi:MAG: hypothetical protein JW896_00960 [Deltaproteobacteria bacterium]|nr:hypothetical protein [Deltaproteobacteria bacterium]
MSRNCKTMEQQYNIPSVGGAAANIIHYALNHDFKYTNGSPIRYIAFPFPVAGQPQSVHHQYIFEGKDVVTGKPMMQAFIDALTLPLSENEKYRGPAPEPPAGASRFLGPDTEENLHQLFKDLDYTDYLPIVLPTEERVANMLKGTSHEPDEVIKTLDWPGGKREVTVERVATCAVMAGARPEHLPVILALANHVPFGNSTSSMANMILVNGPIRDEINMNYGTNVMGPHNEANSVIGRSYTIMSKTIGGLHSEKTTWSSLGSTMQYNNVCIAENEERLPNGWEPFHVQMGFKPEDSVISVGIGWSYISGVVMAVRERPVHTIMGDYMKTLMMGSVTVIMDPTVADLLKESLGFQTKNQLSKWFADNVETTDFSSGKKIKPFQESRIKIVVTGGGVQTTWFVTDFMMGPGMMGGSTLIDDWR